VVGDNVVACCGGVFDIDVVIDGESRELAYFAVSIVNNEGDCVDLVISSIKLLKQIILLTSRESI
jgi:hypothetical protein